jgi:membrane protein DedA with SNARE-associated domain/membrane-associated phospholipid phosphatase
VIDFIRQLIEWIGNHPHWAGVIIAMVAFAESLAFVGLVVPGALMMFAAGALIAGGTLGFWSTFLWAVAGAILGDGLSYWLGHRYRGQIAMFWPFNRHPELLTRGEAFFHRHGGKSILLGRFIGPVRPVIPLVAGMLDMPPVRFYVSNVLSALGWAPAYLIPGMAFGASLVLAGAVAGRLALLVALLVIIGWLITVVIRYLYKFTNVRAEHWTTAVVQWAHTHRRLAWLLGDLLESGRSPNRALLIWLLLLISGAWLFLGILEDVVTLDPLVKADQAFYHLFQNIRGPLGDRLMVVLSELGDWVVVTAVTVFVALWLVQRRAWHDLGYWLAAVAFGALAVVSFKTLLQVQRPIDLYSGLDVYSFPSGHATMSMVVYGFATVLGASELSPRLRVIPYTVAGLLITGIALSRLYLGAHWLSDVAGGLALGLAWVALLAIARQRHPRHRLGTAFAPAVAIVLSAVWIWHAHGRLEVDLVRYAIRQPVQIMGREDWWVQGWKQLPAYRLDLEGEYEQPLNVQWAGELAEIRKFLTGRGWREPVPLNGHTVLRYLMPSPVLTELPLLPQLHDGRYESLLMVREPGVSNGKLLVLHIWSTTVRLDPDQTPVWIGTLAWLDLERYPLLAFPVTADDSDQAVAASIWFSGYCFERPAVQQQRQKEAAENPNTVLLVCRVPTTDKQGQTTFY